MNPIKKFPIPACGVALGIATLGNLLLTTSLPNAAEIRLSCGILAGLLIAMFLLKCLCYPSMVAADFKNSVLTSVSCTCTMSLMLLSTYIKPWIGSAAYYLWLIAIVAHVLLVIYFAWNFVIKLKLDQVFGSFFIPFAGLSVPAVTAPAYNQQGLGTVFFWIAFTAVLFMLVLVTVRYMTRRQIAEPSLPLICIYTAPMNLCLVGYVQSVTPKSLSLLLFMYALACVLYVFALCKAIQYMLIRRMKFYPSFASYTFPFAISALSSKQVFACAATLGSPLPEIFATVGLVQTVIATVLVLYVTLLFLKFLFAPAKA